MDYMPIADFIAEKRFVRHLELIEAGFNPATIARATARGDLVRMDLGIYADPVASEHWKAELAVATCAFPRSVIAGASAAQQHELCDVMPHAISILAPHVSRHKTALITPISISRTRRPEALTEGIEALDVAGYQVPITSPARTVIDLHLTGDEQSAAMSLVTYMHRGLDVMELDRLSAVFGIFDQLAPVTIALQLRAYG
ncbi:hypothetical protein BSY19_5261 (plasmid) [Bosea sp. RAC05]|nr:hypothetical protein BSY19_5261 [Bosea sp. RAC05]